METRVKSQLTATLSTEHFEIHSRPGALTPESLAEIGRIAEAQLGRICRRLELNNDRTYTLFLFESHAALTAATGLPGNVTGLALDAAAYVSSDDLLALVHELVHLIADSSIGEAATPALSEGLAEAMLGSYRRLPVRAHAQAAYFRQTKRLPTLAELSIPDYTKWQETVADTGYGIACSWAQYFLETYGPAKFKQFYVGGDSVAAFGVPLTTIEASWHAALDRYELSPLERDLMETLYADVQPEVSTYAAGTSIILGTKPKAGLAYQWTKNGAVLEGATAAKLRFASLTLDDAGTYRLIATSGKRKFGTTYIIRVVPAAELPRE